MKQRTPEIMFEKIASEWLKLLLSVLPPVEVTNSWAMAFIYLTIFQYFVEQQHGNDVFNCHFISAQPIESEQSMPDNIACCVF